MKKRNFVLGMILAGAAGLVSAESLYIDANGNIGVGTNTPDQRMHVLDGNFKVEQTGAAVGAQLIFATAGGSWDILQNGTTGRLAYRITGTSRVPMKMDPQANNNLLKIGIAAADTVEITGRLLINGTELVPDYVFHDDYPLESIEDHAEFMFKNKHLPALKKAPADLRAHKYDVLGSQMAMLEELEKAHIYISQLNQTLNEMKAEIQALKEKQK